ncbi:hypothetical protein AMTR_s02769p00008890, partial [Amborella trichopoda]
MGAISKYSKGWLWWLITIAIAALIITAAVFTLSRKKGKSQKGPLPVPGPPGAISAKYSEALKVSLQFFDVQK